MGQNFNNFGRINDRLIVGAHPRDADDIDLLYNQNNQNRVTAIVNLQRSGEPDRGDIDAITEACALLDNRIWYQRVPIRDGNGESLCFHLPEAVGILNRAILERATEPPGTVYLHCCRGIGRSPSVAVAYFFWFTDMTLDDAIAFVIAGRNVAVPNRPAIIQATNNILGANVNGNIGAAERVRIQGHVTTLPRVTNA
ncbi:unnamed protein product [Sphagnum jensenii]|uniref:Tyrosine specific protein phosphatases domain-containing protein n=1 Tax=Sphagnum jensenii TaxID=128206 RepID=A0ABP0VWM9_9BRYO